MNKLKFLDVNVVMYAAGKSHKYKQSCVNILSQIEEGKTKAAINTEIVQEILYRYHSIGLLTEASELSWYLLDIGAEVLEIKRKDLEMALYYYQTYHNKGITPRDAIHTATMVNNGIKEIISTDRHFDKIREVERIDPLDFK